MQVVRTANSSRELQVAAARRTVRRLGYATQPRFGRNDKRPAPLADRERVGIHVD